jgi:hypothetical protein
VAEVVVEEITLDNGDVLVIEEVDTPTGEGEG